jgi:hypothetical protein
VGILTGVACFGFACVAVGGFELNGSVIALLSASHLIGSSFLTKDSTTVRAGSTFGIVVRVSGSPTPALSVIGSGVPKGVSFRDEHDGTALISGRIHSPGDYRLTIDATNGVAADALQTFTLRVV